MNPHGTSRSKKRPRDSFESPPDQLGVDSPSSTKRQQRTPGLHTAHRPPGSSKIPLTREALREQNRRSSDLSNIITASALTQSIQLFARHGGPDLTDLRGFCSPEKTMTKQGLSRKRPTTTYPSESTRKTRSSYDPRFEQNMIDGGIYPHNRASNPGNIGEIRDHLSRPRPSLSPSQPHEAEFEEFAELCEDAVDETGVMVNVIPIIAGKGRKQHYHAFDHPFNKLEPLAKELPVPVPDIYDGALPRKIDKRVFEDLNRHIVPCNNTALPAAPNFFTEGKQAGGRADVAKLQACHDGAIGSRAMHSLQTYRTAQPQFDGNAYSYSSTFHDGQLKLYGTHPTQPESPGGPPKYHMTQIGAYAMTHSSERFVEGATAFRNLRDLAKSHRDAFIEQANAMARNAPPTDSPTLIDVRGSRSILDESEFETSTDDLAIEQVTVKRPKHRSSTTRNVRISSTTSKHGRPS